MKDGSRPKAGLYGVTRPVTIAVEHVGHEAGLWGGYRHGFAALRILRSGIIV